MNPTHRPDCDGYQDCGDCGGDGFTPGTDDDDLDAEYKCDMCRGTGSVKCDGCD